MNWVECNFGLKSYVLFQIELALRAHSKRGNWMQKKVIKQAFWLVNEQRSSQIANQIYFFQIKHAPWMAQLWRKFFPDCVIIKITWSKLRREIRVCKVQNILHANFFMFILLISSHTVFLVHFGINLHLSFSKHEIALAEATRAISAFWKTHSCKLIPNWTRNRMITYTNSTLLSSITIINHDIIRIFN